MITLGDKLRAARTERGISLEDISEETKISLRYLKAIESSDAAGLPGTVFARNFARQYAQYIGINALGIKPGELDEQIQLAFPRESESMPSVINQPAGNRTPQSIEVAPLAEAWNWNKIGLSTLGLLAVLGAGAAIFRVWQEAPGLIESAREQAKQQQVQQAPQQQAAAPVSQPVIATSAPQVQIEQTSTEPTADGQPTAETTITISGNGMAVRVVAEQDTWVSMRANGKSVFAELLKANQSRVISGVENAQLVIGNAGGVKIATNGKDIGPIGLPGQVRTVTLTPEGPKIGAGPLL
jgi:cytoskeleton protein RodZ